MIRQASIFELPQVFRIAFLPGAYLIEKIVLPIQIIVYMARGRVHVDINDVVRGCVFIRGRHIDLICVAEEFRNCGVGRALIDYSENIIRKSYEISRVKAYKGSIEFFKKGGYQYDDYIRMVKRL